MIEICSLIAHFETNFLGEDIFIVGPSTYPSLQISFQLKWFACLVFPIYSLSIFYTFSLVLAYCCVST